MADSMPWILRAAAPVAAIPPRLRLYCFCYAGGSAAAYLPWQAALDPAIELCAIQLPGRASRLMEAPASSMAPLVETLVDVLQAQPPGPFAFFGHSLGALLAFEVARHCQATGRATPLHLVVSGCEAPQQRATGRRLHALPHDELIEALKEYNGTPPEVLAHAELMTLLMPAIRSDFALAETYRYHAGPPLRMPVTMLCGRSDDHVAPGQMAGWELETQGQGRLHCFDGDHFFIHSSRTAVLACLNTTLAAAA